MAKLGPEQQTKHSVLPSLNLNKVTPQTFWVPIYKIHHLAVFNCMVDNKP